MMATHAFTYLDHEDAAVFAQLNSVRYDLLSTVLLCDYFDEQCAQSASGYAVAEITDAFSTAILIRYSRAFVSGVRRGLGEDALATLTAEQRVNHDRLRAFRDKHIAHSVNAFESTKVQARYCLERVIQEGITGIRAEHHRVIGLSSKDVGDAKELCEALMKFVDIEIEKEKVKLLHLVRAMSISDILSQPLTPALMPDHSKIGKRRAGP